MRFSDLMLGLTHISLSELMICIKAGLRRTLPHGVQWTLPRRTRLTLPLRRHSTLPQGMHWTLRLPSFLMARGREGEGESSFVAIGTPPRTRQGSRNRKRNKNTLQAMDQQNSRRARIISRTARPYRPALTMTLYPFAMVNIRR
jgi:hypothetical protein